MVLLQLLSGYLPFDDPRNPNAPALSGAQPISTSFSMPPHCLVHAVQLVGLHVAIASKQPHCSPLLDSKSPQILAAVIWKGILSEQPSFRRSAWKEVSDEAKDFVSTLLNKVGWPGERHHHIGLKVPGLRGLCFVASTAGLASICSSLQAFILLPLKDFACIQLAAFLSCAAHAGPHTAPHGQGCAAAPLAVACLPRGQATPAQRHRGATHSALCAEQRAAAHHPGAGCPGGEPGR